MQNQLRNAHTFTRIGALAALLGGLSALSACAAVPAGDELGLRAEALEGAACAADADCAIGERCDLSGGDLSGGLCAAQTDFYLADSSTIPDNDRTGISRGLEVRHETARVASVEATVRIDHTYRGDLSVSLRSPSGTELLLHDREGGSADDLDLTVALEAFAGEPARGSWTLVVRDLARRDVGTLRAFGLRFTFTFDEVEESCLSDEDCGEGMHCPVTRQCITAPCYQVCVPVEPSTCAEGEIATAEGCALALPIPDADPAGVSHTVELLGPASATSAEVRVEIEHTYRGDLSIRLVAPNGSERVLSDRQGGGADDFRYSGTIDLGGASALGAWTLHVADLASLDVGVIRAFEVTGLSSTLGATCGGFRGTACDEGQVCHWEIGATCGWADATGTCELRPDFCPALYQPVCGCDGRTYSNECAALAAGTSALSDGPCP